MSEEDILRVIRRHPDVLVEALSSRPEVLAGLILKLAPWSSFATKDDVKLLIDLVNKRFEELKEYSDKRFEDINKRFEDVNRRFEELMAYSEKRFEDMNRRFEAIDKRFEDVNKRFEDVNRRFEAVDKRFEDINKRFEDVNRRFEDLTHYVDKRVGLVEKLLVGFNVPILVGVITLLIKAFMG